MSDQRTALCIRSVGAEGTEIRSGPSRTPHTTRRPAALCHSAACQLHTAIVSQRRDHSLDSVMAAGLMDSMSAAFPTRLHE